MSKSKAQPKGKHEHKAGKPVQVLPIVLRQPRKFDGQDFLPGHQIAEITILEKGVSLNFLVDAIKDKIASEVVTEADAQRV